MNVQIGNVVSNVSVRDDTDQMSDEHIEKIVQILMTRLREQGVMKSGRSIEDGEIPDRMSETGTF